MDTPASGSRPGDADRPPGLVRWRWPLTVGLLVATGLVLTFLDIATEFPSQVTFALDSSVDDGVAWMVANWRGFFRSITGVLLQVLGSIEDLLLWLPWWLFMALVGLLAWRVRSYKFALAAVSGLLFIGVVEMWDQAMRTLAVVGSATVMSVIVAVPLGIGMSKNQRLNGLMLPILDTMQTMPSYVYLIPAIYFLGLGKVPAVVATMVYAVPPAMRLTNLGIRLVSTELKEAALAFGATPWQMLIKVELPLARPTIMAGINHGLRFQGHRCPRRCVLRTGERAPEVTEFLGNMFIGALALGDLAAWKNDNNKEWSEAAVYWLKNNEDVWVAWVTEDAARNVRKALTAEGKRSGNPPDTIARRERLPGINI